MIDIPASEDGPQDLEVRSRLPESLPVLPLMDAVPFPETLTPLAVSQERSIKLVNDVLGGDRMLVMATSRTGDIDSPKPEDLYEVGVAGTVARMIKVPDGSLRILVHGAQRVRLVDFVQTEPYPVARVEELPDEVSPSEELEGLFRNVQNSFSEIIEQVPYLPEELQMAVANLEDPAELAHMIAGALRIKTEERQELLEELDVARRLRRLSELLAREAELISIGTKIQSQVESEMEKGQREFFLRQQLKAIQEELGEVDEQEAEAQELREQIKAAELPPHARKQAERELQRFERLPAAGGRARRDPQLPGVAGHAALVEVQRRPHRPQAGAQDAGHRPLRHGEGQGPDPGVPGRAQAQARRQELDPVLRRPARRGQDVAGQVDRLGHGPRVRAHLGRRRARRVRDPRPPAHLHRRHARDDHARHARRRDQQPGADDRRDRQDGRRLPRRPVQRDARGAGPRAELQLPRPLPGPAVRPVAGSCSSRPPTSWTRSPRRCATGWR